MNLYIYLLTLFLMALTAQSASALHVEDVLESIQVEVRAEVIAPCSFSLGENYLSFSARPDDSNSTLLYKAQPIDFTVNCPYADKYHYAFQTSEVKRNPYADNKYCAKGFNDNGDVKDFILFCIRDDKLNYYDVVTEVSPDDGNFTGTIPPGSAEDATITDTLLFYPWDVSSASGKYTGMLTVVFYVD